MRVVIIVTHLLGTGHLARALTLARAYLTAGHDATVISGGMPAPQLDRGDVPLIQLPPLRSDGVNFARLLTADQTQATQAYHASRQDTLIKAIAAQKPDILITELFPFGRRMLRAEFGAALVATETQRPRPLICASIRDILAPPSTPKKADKTHALIDRHYDAVLVHADPEVTPLALSWPVPDSLQPKLHYTGFVAPPPAGHHPDRAGADEVLVTAGGGDVGAHIFEAALSAASGSDLTWRILLGGSGTQAAALAEKAPQNVIIEPARPDFRQMLHHAAACICMCGYNTALDLLQSGCGAVVIPFDAGHEVEQTIRAKAFATLRAITVLPSDALTPQSLRRALETVLAAPSRPPATTGFDGAARTVEITETLRKSLT